MKARIFIAVLVTAAVLFTASTFAHPLMSTQFKANTVEAIEANHLIGLASDNEGLRIACAFDLGEMKSQNAVNLLVKSLREGTSSEERIVAALSLVKIGDPQGIYMLSRSAKFNTDDRARRICEKFYNGYLMQKAQETAAEKNAEVALGTN